MRRWYVLMLSLVVAIAASVSAQDQAGTLAPLQGRWTVTAAEHNGKPLDAIKGGVMTIAGDAFEVRTASGNVLKGTLRPDPSKTPAHLDMLHADGEKWEAIYEVAGDTFRINYVEAGGKDPRPAKFTTSATTEESLVTMRREQR
jgi:uncharacterized protein (TIGR03067 family)